MNEAAKYIHYSVFYREVLEWLRPVALADDATVVDCTLGEGGHSNLILKEFLNIKMICFERDPEILEKAKERLSQYGDRVSFINDNFSNFDFYFKGTDPKLSGILYDFGISSYHFDASDRGFTFREEQPLDMRLDNNSDITAEIIVNDFTEKEIADIIYTYGEERQSRRIASFIVNARNDKRIKTTTELADIVMKSIPKKFRPKNIHPATRTFQALRIYINNELDAIKLSLNYSWKYLRPGGRILAISFHSLEDRIAKTIFKQLSTGCFCKGDEPFCQCDRVPRIKILTKKPILPTPIELEENNRSRSAKLRVVEKI